mmetsp:Transcript_24588/g.40480  ORF Transcript_24588/g.40480 Transcript_24588/m.40480 type:complete len:283 (+) Transcript_24588:102-950(+)|eukprot:CAMPEP_0184341548 /NCGR_PEP_ID=MMETSP1089-20130417/10152_1 /TAXON_ID=38269 ORGANISM="Gloeochaete wittrockiana, Strain SAG46.84" /NCGR_SAMPLE_ID=MMETSP1089 /ASSEMBLY_ACC=CAM_ASM_000445 /LENGTH=282 /DNA_ID=CAMNT_0026669895 /DNA_START=84 /DNA_END=932 /DNA_ORIENTATION=-
MAHGSRPVYAFDAHAHYAQQQQQQSIDVVSETASVIGTAPTNLSQFFKSSAGNVPRSPYAQRMLFLRKVYAMVNFQLLTNLGTCAAALYVPYLYYFLRSSDVTGLFFVGSLVCVLVLYAYKTTYPYNMYWFFAFTAVSSLATASIIVHYSVSVVFESIILTAVVVGGMTLYTFQTRMDLSFLGQAIAACSMAFFAWGMLGFWGRMGSWYSLATTLLFAMYLAFRTWNMTKGSFDVDDPIPTVIGLYTDIIYLFHSILQLVQQHRDRFPQLQEVMRYVPVAAL